MGRSSDSERPFGNGGGSAASAPDVLPSWLLMAKVMAPAPPAGYVRRASLLHRVDTVLDRRLTVLQAPGGFGKTTVLADVSHRKKKQGVIAAWLSLDRDDTADVFGHYLARAFEHAGLNLSTIDDDDAWSSSPFKQQLGMLARAIELHADPCLLVLDEVELLPSGTVESIDLLLKRSPRNLHVAMAFRSNPGLDLAEHFLDGSAIVLKARQFRFSRPEIARFFDRALSRRELATVEERTAGWPVALMVDRNMRAVGAEPPDVDAAGFSENYVGVRLLRGLSKQDRESLFDLAVFDWIDAELGGRSAGIERRPAAGLVVEVARRPPASCRRGRRRMASAPTRQGVLRRSVHGRGSGAQAAAAHQDRPGARPPRPSGAGVAPCHLGERRSTCRRTHRERRRIRAVGAGGADRADRGRPVRDLRDRGHVPTARARTLRPSSARVEVR